MKQKKKKVQLSIFFVKILKIITKIYIYDSVKIILKKKKITRF